MGEISFVVHQMGTQGSYLNHLDLQQYLKDVEGYNIRFYCENVKKLFEVIKDSRRKYIFDKGKIKVLRKNIIEPHVVITDFKTLIKFYQLGIWVACKKVLVMDSIELTYHLKNIKSSRFFYDVDLYKCLKCFYADEIKFLMPPNNFVLFRERYPNLKAEIFFKNINTQVLNTLEFENREGYFYRWDDLDDYDKGIKEKFGDNCFSFEPQWAKNKRKVPLKYKESPHLFDYKNLVYRRRKYLEYQEQFGRLIFEYILLGKDVYFLEEPYTDDGLTDYLRYYDIKFKDNKIITTKEELKKRMKGYKHKPWEL